jgi:hypothetical protein
MSESSEEAQMLEHLAEMRRAVHGLGKDFAIDFRTLDDKIRRLPRLTGKELKYAMQDIQDDFGHLAHKVDAEFAALPHNIKEKALAAAEAIGSGTSRFASSTREAMADAGHRFDEGRKNTLAKAAGIKRTPMKQWHSPPAADDSADR